MTSPILGISPSPSVALPNSILLNGNFDSSIVGWKAYVTGGNLATVKRTTINPYDGAGCAKYECTRYNASGYVCMQALFSPSAGEIYTVSFRYRSTVSFRAFVLTASDSETLYTYISCIPSSSWTLRSFLANLTWLESTWIDFRFYSTGTIYIDNVSVVPNSMPTPSPTEAPTPKPTASPSPPATPTPTPAGPTPTPTQSATPTPTSTNTPTPTPSPTTTTTPTPTSTNTPTPTPSPEPTTNPAGFLPPNTFYAAAITGVAVIAITMVIQGRKINTDLKPRAH